MSQELEKLWINIAPRYIDREQARAVKKDIGEIDDRVKRLGNTLAKIGTAFAAFGTIAVRQFADAEAAVSEFAGKAGLSLEEFEGRFGKMSERIARQTGVNRRTILQGLQEGVSMGLSDMQLKALAPLAAKLHAGNQAYMTTSLTAAATASKAGFGSPDLALRAIYGTAQVGSGAVADYSEIFKMVAPYAGGTGVGMNLFDSLGMLAAISERAPSLSMGGTWMRSFLIGMLNPKNEGESLMQSRTGQSFADLREMMAGGQIAEVMRIIKDNFAPEEMFKLFGRQEAVSFIGGIDPDYLSEKIGQVISNTQSGPIEKFWSHWGETLRSAMDRLSEAIKLFLESFGEPIARILKGVAWAVNGLSALFKRLNELTFGLIGWIATLVGSLGLAVVAFRAARLLFGGRMIDAIGTAVGSAVGNAMGWNTEGDASRKAERKGDISSTKWFAGASLVSAFTAAAASVIGFWRQIRTFFKGLFGGIMGMRNAILNAAKGFGVASEVVSISLKTLGGIKTPLETADYVASVIDPKGARGLGGRVTINILKFISSTLGRILLGITVIGGILATFYTLFRWASRGTQADKESVARVAARRRLRTHLASGGTMADAPPPGEFDWLDIQIEQARASANYQTSLFIKNTLSVFGNTLRSLLNQLPNTFGLRDFVLDWQNRLGTMVTDAILDFMNAPLDMIRRFLKEAELRRERAISEGRAWTGLQPPSPSNPLGLPFDIRSVGTMLNNIFGGNTDDGRRLQQQAASGAVSTISLTQAEIDALGLQGSVLPYGPAPFPTNPIQIPLPQLPTPRLDITDDDRAARRDAPPINVNLQQTITVNGADDPVKTSNTIMNQTSNFFQRALEEAMQENESPIER